MRRMHDCKFKRQTCRRTIRTVVACRRTIRTGQTCLSHVVAQSERIISFRTRVVNSTARIRRLLTSASRMSQHGRTKGRSRGRISRLRRGVLHPCSGARASRPVARVSGPAARVSGPAARVSGERTCGKYLHVVHESRQTTGNSHPIRALFAHPSSVVARVHGPRTTASLSRCITCAVPSEPMEHAVTPAASTQRPRRLGQHTVHETRIRYSRIRGHRTSNA